MRRIPLAALAAILLLPAAASAQTRTVVTGTVTGTDGIVWNGGSITATIVSGGGASFSLTPCTGGAGCPIAPSTSPTGITATGFSMSPWANVSILPAGTTYTFTATINPGVPPPIGTGPQTCTMTGVTLSGSSQMVNLTGCPALTNVSGSSGSVTAVTATAPVTSSGGTAPNIACATCTVGGVTGVTASAPIVSSGGVTPNLSCPTCTAYVPNSNIIYITRNCQGQVNCFQSPWNTQIIQTATITNGSHAVSSSAPAWASTDCVGGSGCTGTGTSKSIVGFSNCNSGTPNATDAPILPETTIATFVDSEHITTTAAATGTKTSTGCIFWGNPDDTALSAADAAAAALPICPVISIPTGYGWADDGHWNVAIPACNISPVGVGNFPSGYGEQIQGTGKGTSGLFLAPNLYAVNSATCNGGVGANDCFGGDFGQVFSNFELTGGDAIAGGFPSAKNLFEFADYSVCRNVQLDEFAGNDANATVAINDATQILGCGISNFSGNVTTVNDVFVFQSLFDGPCRGNGLSIGAGANGVVSVESYYDVSNCNTTNAAAVVNAGTFTSFGDIFFSETSAQVAGIRNVAGRTSLYGDDFSSALTTFRPCVNNSVSGATTFLQNTNCTKTGSAVTLNGVSGTAFIDGGGNVGLATGGGIASGTPIYGSASATGVPLVATNVTPSTGWGTSGAAGNGVSAPSGSSQLMQFTITAAGVPGLNPTVAVVFPVPFLVAPICSSSIDGSIGSLTSGSLTTSAITSTGLTLTASGTPTAAQTYQIQVGCKNP